MERLRHRADFLAAAAGPRAPTPAFVLQLRQREEGGPPRVGFTATRKIGTAVERNRARRRLREMVRASREALVPGHDYVVIARRSALAHPFELLVADFDKALRRVGRATNKLATVGEASRGSTRTEASP